MEQVTKSPAEPHRKPFPYKAAALAIAAVTAIGGLVTAIGGVGIGKKEESKPVVINNSNVLTIPGLPNAGQLPEGTGTLRRGGERIVFQHSSVELNDPDIENAIGRIAAAVKSLPEGTQAEIVADVGPREDISETLATERIKVVKHLLVTGGVPDRRLRALIQSDRTLPTTVNAINVRWSYQEP